MVLSNAIILCCLSWEDCVPQSESLLLGACRNAQTSIFAERKICSVDLLFLNALNFIIIMLFFIFYFIFLSLHKSWNQKICFVTLLNPSHIYD